MKEKSEYNPIDVKTHVTIALTNPKTPTNVGAVMRAAGCYKADQIIYNGNRYAKAAEYHKHTLQTDTFNMADKIPLLRVESFLALKSYKDYWKP